MKKILLIILSLILAFSMTACGGGGGTGGGGTGGNQGDHTSGNIGEDVYVSVVDAGLGSKWMDDIATAYYEETGITVNVRADPLLTENVSTKMNSPNSEKDDLYFVAQAGNSWLTYAARNLMIPLNDVLESDKYGIPAIERARDNTAIKMGQYLDNNILTLPYVYTSWGLVYNGDILNKIDSNGQYVKGTFPTTVQGIIDLCQAVKSANLTNSRTGKIISPYSAGLSVGYMNYLFFSLWHQLDPEGFQAYYDQNDKTAYQGNLLKSQSAIKAAETLFDIIGATSKTDNNMVSFAQNHIESQTSFVNGDCVFTFSGSWFETEMHEIMEQNGLTNVRFAPYPTFEEGEKSSIPINYPGENFFIPKGSPNIEGAKDFLNFCLSERAVAIMEKSLNQASLFTTSENVELIPFGEDVRSAINNSNNFYSWSENIVYRSGALSLFKMAKNPFTQMAKFEISKKDQIPSSMFEVEIAEHVKTWSDYMILIPEGK